VSLYASQRPQNVGVGEADPSILNKRLRFVQGHGNRYAGTATRTPQTDVGWLVPMVNMTCLQFLPAAFMLDHELEEAIGR
jgi:hypothetical protein